MHTPNEPTYTIYIAKCADNTLYTGITTDLQRRVKEHNSMKKGAAYTASRRPVLVVYSEQVSSRSLALKREYAIKRLTRPQKELLISKNFSS